MHSPSFSMGCCIVNLLTKNQLGFAQEAENNISKLVAGIFCKLSEEQFIPVHLIHPDPPPPLEDWGLVDHRPHLYRSAKTYHNNEAAGKTERQTFWAIPSHQLPPRVLKLQKIKWIVCQIAPAQSAHKRRKKRGKIYCGRKVKTQAALGVPSTEG